MANTVNFSNTTPAAPAGKQNVTWQTDSAGDVSAYPASASSSLEGAVALSGDLGGSSNSPQVVATHLSSPLPVAQGGTGSTTAAGALGNLGAAGLTANTFTGSQTAAQFNAKPSSSNAGVVVVPDVDGETSVAIGVSNAANSSFVASITKNGQLNGVAVNVSTANVSGSVNASSLSLSGAMTSASVSTGNVTANGSITAGGVTSSGSVTGPYVKSTGTIDAVNVNASGSLNTGTATVSSDLTVYGMATVSNITFTGAGTASSANAGSASALPSLPAGYLVLKINGSYLKLPYYNG